MLHLQPMGSTIHESAGGTLGACKYEPMPMTTPESEPQNGADEPAPQKPDSQSADFDNVAGVPLDILLDEHEEEVSEGGQTVRQRGVYLLPNLFTTGTLFAGFYAIIAAMRGDYDSASIAIFAAMVFDGLDGRIARITHTQSKFGVEYDSLSDMVAFGVAPALVMFSWALGELGKIGWSAAFIFVACAALRLARFNTHAGTSDNRFFTGLASPAAAAVLASAMWLCHDLGWVGDSLPSALPALSALITALVGVLMVANFPYYSFKDIDSGGRVPFAAIFMVVVVFGLVTLDPPVVLLAASSSYALSGPVLQLFRWRKRRV